MIINKLIIEGFKNHKKRTEYNLGKTTYITGDNYQGKTTIGEAIAWCLMGADLTGNERATNRLLNDKSKNMAVVMEFSYKGKDHVLTRNRIGTKTEIYLDDGLVKESDLIKFYKDKNVFLSIFIPSYFSGLSPKVAKETLDLVLKNISNEEVFGEMSVFERDLLLDNNFKNSNLFLSNKRNELKEIDKDILFLEGFVAAKTEVGEIPDEKIFKGEELEMLKLERKVITDKIKELDNISKPSLPDTNSILRELESARNQYRATQDERNSLTNVIDCPQCQTKIDLDSGAKDRLNKTLEKLAREGQELSIKLEGQTRESKEVEDRYNKAIEKNKGKLIEFENRLRDLDNLIVIQESIKNSVNENNSNRNLLLRLQKDSEEKIVKSKLEIESHIKDKENLGLQIDAAKAFNSIKLQEQSTDINKYLKDVSIQLSRTNKDGEIIDDFRILYQGREFATLSNSERIRAGLEISNLMIGQIGRKLPIFLDNAESVTEYKAPNTQIIEARVMKDQELKVSVE